MSFRYSFTEHHLACVLGLTSEQFATLADHPYTSVICNEPDRAVILDAVNGDVLFTDGATRLTYTPDDAMRIGKAFIRAAFALTRPA